jgi:cytochrome b subunit of formate dehydrogenase
MPGPSLHRLPDAALWAFLAASGAFCLVHALARSVRRRADAPAEASDTRRHAAFQRFFHAANAFLIAIFAISGLAIYLPRPVDGVRTSLFFSWHVWIVPLFAALVVAHVVHEFRAPDGGESMWPGPGRAAKYSAAQVFYHWAIAGNVGALAVTGAVLWKPLRVLVPLRLLGLGWDFVFLTRVLHGLLTATLLALVLAHVYLALLVPENRRRARSMLLPAGRE